MGSRFFIAWQIRLQIKCVAKILRYEITVGVIYFIFFICQKRHHNEVCTPQVGLEETFEVQDKPYENHIKDDNIFFTIFNGTMDDSVPIQIIVTSLEGKYIDGYYIVRDGEHIPLEIAEKDSDSEGKLILFEKARKRDENRFKIIEYSEDAWSDAGKGRFIDNKGTHNIHLDWVYSFTIMNIKQPKSLRYWNWQTGWL